MNFQIASPKPSLPAWSTLYYLLPFLLLTSMSESSWSQSHVTLHRHDVKMVPRFLFKLNSPALFGFPSEVLFARREVNFFLNTCEYLPTGINLKLLKNNTQYWYKYPQHHLSVRESVDGMGRGRKQRYLSLPKSIPFKGYHKIGIMLCNQHNLCANRNLFQITD